MGSKETCERFTWCTGHASEDDKVSHVKEVGFGIMFVFDEDTNEHYVNWMPDWADWHMKPGEVHQELHELETVLGSLNHYLTEFGKEVTR